ncbi:hypothetical protein ACN267_32250 [Micromonospora sp. WMMD734]|uniref:hypothetical protein n=1 Tax=Micromonospora sp. WMMD734 TaxID=3404129 RepID=UPI003B960DCA
MTPALALEALMLHPRYEELMAHVRAHTPTGHVDQVDAAADDALRLMTTVGRAAYDGHQRHHPTTADVPGWLRLGLLDTLTAWVDGQAVTCRHQPTPDRPQPIVAAAWRPRLVVCSRCVHLTALARGSARDRTCDACGRVCAGVEHGDGVYPGMVQLGPLVYQYGTCDGCRPPAVDSHPVTAGRPVPGSGRSKPRGARGRGRGRGARR